MIEQVPPEWYEDDQPPEPEPEINPAEPTEEPEKAPEPQPVASIERARSIRIEGYGRFSDVSAEQQIVGWLLRFPGEVDRVTHTLTGEEFWNPLYRQMYGEIHDRWARGEPTDPASLADGFDFADMIDLQAFCEITAPETLMGELVELTRRRKLARAMTDAMNELNDAGHGLVADDVLETVQAQFNQVSAIGQMSQPSASSWAKLAARQDEMPEWLIDGIIRERHRLVLVGTEGSGKSTVLRQMAFCAAAGLHPFHRRPLKGGPIRTLTVDLENPRDQVSAIAEWLRRALIKQDREMEIDWMNLPGFVVEWEGGIDIRRRADRARLENEIRQARPQLMVIGPIYKLYQKKGSESEEEVAGEVCSVLDDWRVRYDMAICMEHHAPHGYAGKRAMRPVGSSYWLRWPEYGITMQRDKEQVTRFNIGRFRGDRMPVNWPSALDRSKHEVWPVTGIWADGQLGKDDPQLGKS